MAFVIPKIRVHFAVLGLLITFSFLSPGLNAQKLTQPSRQVAYDHFNRGEFDKALQEFTILLNNYPKDPIYKYYCGVCLVKSEKEPEKAVGYLREALVSQQAIRPIPDDAWFYLGRSQQLAGHFTDAVGSYNLFEKNAGKKAARDLKVQDFIRECNEGTGKLKDTVYGDVVDKAVGNKKEEHVPQRPDSGITGKPVTTQVTQKKKQVPDNYDRKLTEAMDYQVKADSLKTIAANYRQDFEKLPSSERPVARARIDETEALSARYQKMADEKFGRSDTAAATGQRAIMLNPQMKPKEQNIQDTAKKNFQNKQVNDKPVLRQAEVVPETADIYSIFAIASDTGTVREQKVEIDPRLPAGLVYRLQIGVYKKPLNLSFFKGIIPVSGFKIPGTSSFRYFAGMFRKDADAGKALLKVRQAGFRDAFVASAFDGKPVSLERAALLEKEWGQKPFLTVIDASRNNSGISVTPTLIFRVEIMKTLIPLSDEATETLRNLAGNRGLDVLMTAGGSFVYLIGKFITFESATEYAGLLKRNGYIDARVAAYLGEKEIPVERAKQLYEKAK